MKAAVIFYHKNVDLIYSAKWISQCVDSIRSQTYTDFDVFELDYGGEGKQYCSTIKAGYHYYNKPFRNHISAMNFIISEVFFKGYDVVFNTNLDDYYSSFRFEKQITEINNGFQLISSDFVHIKDDNEVRKMDMSQCGGLEENFNQKHNIIAHPVVCIHKSFWDSDLHYKNLLGYEDLDLWQRALKKGKKFKIIPEYLLYYRLHEEQVGRKNPATTPAQLSPPKPKKAKTPKKINLFLVATNRYVEYLQRVLSSAEEYLFKEENVTYNVFTDNIRWTIDALCHNEWFWKVKIFKVEHKPFPHTTLYRYHYFQEYKKYLGGDFHFYIDVDSEIKKEIPNSILSDITVVQHCGFVGERGSYESREASTSFVPEHEGEIYYGGGFWGFSNEAFWKFIDVAVDMVNKDADKGIIPVWHDESVLNKYLLTTIPTKVLTPAYHYPEGSQFIKDKWKEKKLSYKPVILLLEKDHNKVRF